MGNKHLKIRCSIRRKTTISKNEDNFYNQYYLLVEVCELLVSPVTSICALKNETDYPDDQVNSTQYYPNTCSKCSISFETNKKHTSYLNSCIKMLLIGCDKWLNRLRQKFKALRSIVFDRLEHKRFFFVLKRFTQRKNLCNSTYFQCFCDNMTPSFDDFPIMCFLYIYGKHIVRDDMIRYIRCHEYWTLRNLMEIPVILKFGAMECLFS
jgi:hypothetical protein